MPESNPILHYEVREPQFSMNSSGTQITARLPIHAVRQTPVATPSLYSGFDWWMKTSHLSTWNNISGSTYQTRASLFDLVDESLGAAMGGSVTFGYAVVAESVASARAASGRGTLWQSDVSPFATLPLRPAATGSAVPTISSEYVSFSFATPSQPSRLWLSTKFPGASPSLSNSPFTDPTLWYSHNIEGPSVNGVPVAPGTFYPYDPIMWYGDLETWHVPSVSISLNPPGVRTGESATVTVQAPESLGTLTASNFVVVGGTLTNFSQST